MNSDLISYYKARANEYEKLYAKPERQEDLNQAASLLQEIFAGKQVLEIACGTGYWTEKIAQTAVSIFATDINEEVIEVAQQKEVWRNNVSFGTVDLYHFSETHGYESLFGGFIWSHVLLQDLGAFLAKVNSLVKPSGTVVFMDNQFVEGSNLPITKTDELGNTYQTRILEDQSKHLVLKNFPPDDFLLQQLKDFSKQIEIVRLQYYWLLIYTT